MTGVQTCALPILDHCHIGPVKKEFLDPIIKIKEEIINRHGVCFMFLIHGMSARIQKIVNDNVHMVIGYGQGDPPSYSCDLEYKDRFMYVLQLNGFNAYQGQSGGRFSAWHEKNMNQLFRKKYKDERVHSLQIEIISGLRTLPQTAENVGIVLGQIANRTTWRLDKVPVDFSVREFC